MEKKKVKLFSAIALITLALLVVGVTYAYFQNQYGSASNADVNVTTYTTDVLTFTTGDDINLEADQTTFGKDKGSVSGATYASALLTANNKTNKAVEHYYLYLNIENNTFTYSVQDNKPELIMTITDKDGNEVKNIEGLTYTEVTDRTNKKISGYDITTKSGLVTIFNNREIIAAPKAEDKWNITITFVNYEADQNANTGKALSAKLIIQKNEMFDSLSDVCSGGETLTSCITSLSQKSASNISKIYHHDGTLENGINDGSYRYAGGDNACTFNGENVQGAYSNATFGASNETDCQKVYTIKSDAITLWLDNSVTRLLSDEKPVTWTDGACKTTDGESINIGFDSGDFNPVTEATCKGKSYLVKTDALTARVANLNMEYVGVGTWDKVNNYVCFGSNESPCPTDNLYRIIGVFDHKISEKQTEKRVKLIKSDYATSALLGADGDYKQAYTATGYGSSYYKGNNLANIAGYTWNYKNNTTINNGYGSNTWSTSLLNKTNLNKNFITNIGADWATKIAETTWKVGGNTWSNIGNQPAKTAYQNEIVSSVTTNTTDNATDYSAKVGLMYASDYGFAAAPSAWTTILNNYDGKAIKSVNWMYMGLVEWTISRTADYAYLVFLVNYIGYVDLYYATLALALRPVFYLSSSVNYASGSGTAADPILVN